MANVRRNNIPFSIIALMCTIFVNWGCNETLILITVAPPRDPMFSTRGLDTNLSIMETLDSNMYKETDHSHFHTPIGSSRETSNRDDNYSFMVMENSFKSPTTPTNGPNQEQSAENHLFAVERVENNQSKETFHSLSSTGSAGRSSSRVAMDDVQSIPLEMNACNYAKGKWIKDNRRPSYSGYECKQWLSPTWACRLMKRIDFFYENFRWRPQGCGVPEFSGHKFLKRHRLLRMQHKTIAFVGDSLGRQQFQSLMCMITAGKTDPRVKDVGNVYQFKHAMPSDPTAGPIGFGRTNTTILFHWSASLCAVEPHNKCDPATIYAMHLDRPTTFLLKHLNRFDVLVLSSGHHWNRGKFSANLWEMYVDGKPNTDRRIAEIRNAKNLSIHSVVKWLDAQLLQHPRLEAFLRTISPRHFVNREWDTGGSCDNTVPLASGSEVSQDGSGDHIAEAAIRGTKVKLWILLLCRG